MMENNINIKNREYNIFEESIYYIRNNIFDNNEKEYNKYVLHSLKHILENKKDKKIYIVSKAVKKDKPYKIDEVSIEKRKKYFVFDRLGVSREIDIDGINKIIGYQNIDQNKEDILFFEMSVFVDYYLKDSINRKNTEYKKKLIKKLQNYYDDSKENNKEKLGVLPAYRIKDLSNLDDDKNDSIKEKILYSHEHFRILKEVHSLLSLKLLLKDIYKILLEANDILEYNKILYEK